MSSGITVQQACIDRYLQMKLKRDAQYIIFAMTPNYKEITVSEVGNPGASYEEFKNRLLEIQKKGECRYAVFDTPFKTSSGQDNHKLIFILWAPDDAKNKERMVYASSKESIKKKLEGLSKEVQANDPSDIDWSHILEVVSS